MVTPMADPRSKLMQPDGAEAARLKANVGALLAAHRTRAGLTQAELATRAGVGAPTVSKYEQGRTRPSWPTLTKLAAALCPGDPVRARALADDLADAAGPSLAGNPQVPLTLAREQLVTVLTRTAEILGMDLDDDQVRHVVVEQIRALTGGQPPGERPALPAFAGDAPTLNGGRP